MKRIPKWSVVLVLLLVGLSACQPATPVATATPVPSPTMEPTNTSVPPTATPVPSPTVAATSSPPPAEATPTRETVAQATPTRPWQIPSLLDGDHGKGNPDAGLVLVEYSDFQ